MQVIMIATLRKTITWDLILKIKFFKPWLIWKMDFTVRSITPIVIIFYFDGPLVFLFISKSLAGILAQWLTVRLIEKFTRPIKICAYEVDILYRSEIHFAINSILNLAATECACKYARKNKHILGFQFRSATVKCSQMFGV